MLSKILTLKVATASPIFKSPATAPCPKPLQKLSPLTAAAMPPMIPVNKGFIATTLRAAAASPYPMGFIILLYVHLAALVIPFLWLSFNLSRI